MKDELDECQPLVEFLQKPSAEFTKAGYRIVH